MVKSRLAHIEAWHFAMEAAAFFTGLAPHESANHSVHAAEDNDKSEGKCLMASRLMMAMYPMSRKGKALSRRKVLPSLQPLPEETDASQEAKNRAMALEDSTLASRFGQLKVSDVGKEREGRSCNLPPRPRPCKSKQSLKRRLCRPLRKLRDQYVSCMREIDGMGDFTGAVSGGPHAIIYAQEPRHSTYFE